jgi:hypothetical protein
VAGNPHNSPIPEGSRLDTLRAHQLCTQNAQEIRKSFQINNILPKPIALAITILPTRPASHTGSIHATIHPFLAVGDTHESTLNHLSKQVRLAPTYRQIPTDQSVHLNVEHPTFNVQHRSRDISDLDVQCRCSMFDVQKRLFIIFKQRRILTMWLQFTGPVQEPVSLIPISHKPLNTRKPEPHKIVRRR